MSLSLYQRDFGYCLKQASDWLGGPVCALLFPWNLEQLLRKRMRLLARRGLGTSHALVQIAEDRTEGEISVGMEMYELPTPEQPIRLVHVVLPYLRATSCVPDFWAVAEADYKRASRSVRRLGRRSARACAPVMPTADRDRLWRNTVGFLLASRQEFRRFRIPKKRGVLLSGAPGNGKTMACRWLRGECRRHGLRWRNVTVADYQLAREQHGVSSLFHLDRPGIVLFDDLDFGIRDRQTTGASADHSTFLAELDGVVGRRGAVYLFTSNAALAELDSAFRRPGRIDVVMEFAQPNATLRAQFIDERWQSDICEAIDIDEVIADTDGLSVADLEELRKLLVLHYLEHQSWDWPRTWRIFRRGRAPTGAGDRIGFGAKNTADEEEVAVRLLSGNTCRT